MKYFSTFSGIGGFELGMPKDWECVGYSEIDKYSIQTYEKNFKHKNYGDITKIDTSTLPDFDLLVGGFPCQPFSIAGKRKGFEDTRGTLFFELARILKDKKPRYFVFENVKGLLSFNSGRAFKTIISTLNELGYDLQWQVLNSKNFGVPQNRERVFIIGHLRGTSRPKVFPIWETNDSSIKVYTRGKHQQDIVYKTDGIMPSLPAGTHGSTKHLTKILARDFKDPKLVKVADYRNDEGLRIRKEPISPCLSARRTSATDISTMPPVVIRKIIDNGGKITEKKEGVSELKVKNRIRRLTPIECERLQGFPDDWTKGVSDTQRYKQLGNAITTCVVKEIINKLNL